MSNSKMRIVFWQNCLSPHQLPYIVHLINDSRVDEVVIVAGEALNNARKEMGWNVEAIEGLDKCKVYITPHDAIIESLLSKRPNDSYHLFSGIHADAYVFKCLEMSMKYTLHRGIITERPNTYNFKWNIPNGKPYWMHRLRFFIQDRKYAKSMEYVFAIGNEAVYYFKSLGLRWKVHSFCYCTQTFPQNYNIIKSSSPLYVFVGSLSIRKNPISIVQALSRSKHGIVKFIGNGDLKDKLQKEIESNNLQEQIKLLGTIPQHQIPQYLYDSDVLILPSLYDGWGAVVNEALQAGCFVICSNACGASALLENNSKLGVVFKAGDNKGLAYCMEYVNSNLKEIRNNRDFRREWAETNISGQAVAKYFVDSLAD